MTEPGSNVEAGIFPYGIRNEGFRGESKSELKQQVAREEVEALAGAIRVCCGMLNGVSPVAPESLFKATEKGRAINFLSPAAREVSIRTSLLGERSEEIREEAQRLIELKERRERIYNAVSRVMVILGSNTHADLPTIINIINETITDPNDEKIKHIILQRLREGETINKIFEKEQKNTERQAQIASARDMIFRLLDVAMNKMIDYLGGVPPQILNGNPGDEIPLFPALLYGMGTGEYSIKTGITGGGINLLNISINDGGIRVNNQPFPPGEYVFRRIDGRLVFAKPNGEVVMEVGSTPSGIDEVYFTLSVGMRGAAAIRDFSRMGVSVRIS